jgi:hypothetical protein
MHVPLHACRGPRQEQNDFLEQQVAANLQESNRIFMEAHASSAAAAQAEGEQPIGARRGSKATQQKTARVPVPPAAPPPQHLLSTPRQPPEWAMEAAHAATQEQVDLHYNSKSGTWWASAGDDPDQRWVWHKGQWWRPLTRPSRRSMPKWD